MSGRFGRRDGRGGQVGRGEQATTSGQEDKEEQTPVKTGEFHRSNIGRFFMQGVVQSVGDAATSVFSFYCFLYKTVKFE
jgi:hypothetical protein